MIWFGNCKQTSVQITPDTSQKRVRQIFFFFFSARKKEKTERIKRNKININIKTHHSSASAPSAPSCTSKSAPSRALYSPPSPAAPVRRSLPHLPRGRPRSHRHCYSLLLCAAASPLLASRSSAGAEARSDSASGLGGRLALCCCCCCCHGVGGGRGGVGVHHHVLARVRHLVGAGGRRCGNDGGCLHGRPHCLRRRGVFSCC